MSMTEREVQAKAVLLLRNAGAEVTYHTHDSRRSDEGYPDLTAPVAGKIWAVECKTSTGRLTPAQALWANEWAQHGGRWFLATPETLGQLEAHLRAASATEAGGKSCEALIGHLAVTAGRTGDSTAHVEIGQPLRVNPDEPREQRVHQLIHALGCDRARAEEIEAHNSARGG